MSTILLNYNSKLFAFIYHQQAVPFFRLLLDQIILKHLHDIVDHDIVNIRVLLIFKPFKHIHISIFYHHFQIFPRYLSGETNVAPLALPFASLIGVFPAVFAVFTMVVAVVEHLAVGVHAPKVDDTQAALAVYVMVLYRDGHLAH